MKSVILYKLLSRCLPFIMCAVPVSLNAQGAPLKPGLWETQVNVNRTMALPPEAEAKIAAMPAAQQAQVRSMMGGGAGSAPVVTTRQVCVGPQSTMDSMLNRAQQTPGTQCSFTNRVQTSNGASFDMSCTMPQGSATGHTSFRRIDDDHASSASHMNVTGSSQGHTMNMTLDTTTSAKFVSSECGDVKPFTPTPIH